MVSTGSADIVDGTPTPHLYAYALYKLACGDTLVNVTVKQGSSTKVSAFGSTFSGGELGLVLVNADSAPHKITLASATQPERVIGWVITSSEPTAVDPLSARGVTWNGHSDPDVFPLLSSLGAYSVDVDPTAAGVVFEIPAYAVAGLVIF